MTSSSSSSSSKTAWSKALTDAETRFKQLFGSSSSEWKRVQGNSDVSVHKHTREDVYRLVLDVPSSNSLSPFLSVLTTPELRQEWDPAVIEASLLERDMDMDMRITKTNFTLGWPASPRDAVMISRTRMSSDAVVDISTSLPRSTDEPAYLRPSPPYVRSNVALLAWCIQQLGSKIRITCFSQHDLRLTMFSSSSTSAAASQLSTMVLGLLRTTIKRANRIPKLIGYGSGVSLERVRFQIDREALTVEYLIVPGEGDEGVMDKDMPMPSPPRAIECILPAGEGWDVQVTTRASEEEVQRLPWTATATRGSSYPQPNPLPNSSYPQPTPLPNSSSTSVSPSSATSSPLPLDQIHFRITHSPQTIDDHSVIKVKVVIEISAGGPSSSSSRGRERLRLNGVVQSIRDPTIGMPGTGLYGNSQRVRSMSIIPDAGDGSSLHGSMASSIAASSIASSSSNRLLGAVDTVTPALGRGGRTPAAEKTILSRVKRNYIYFSSLLQEPEAKWKRTTESRGVTITQLDSIDPTLVVYRAEATFVGVGLWDMFGAVVAPGTSRGFVPSGASGRSGSTGGGLGSGNNGGNGDAVLLEDVNDLTELWYLKTRGVWPINGRDSVVLKTVYKSPTTIHVFSFSADDLAHLFPSLASSSSSPLDPNNPNLNSSNSNSNPPLNNPSSSSSSNLIRTQVDLQGFSIEALSPNTTLLTLLEQSDPKGWISNTSTLPNQMINALAGIGEFAIKCGGPPVVTRLLGARKNWDGVRYDHERGVFRVEYESDLGRASASPTTTTTMTTGTTGIPALDNSAEGTSSTTTSPTIECEIRCDMDTWAHSLDIVVDPPPQSISCLRRHRLSDEGGGLWITVVHDAVSVAGFSGSPGSGSNNGFGSNTNTDDSRLQIIIRRGPGREKGLVMVNGAKAQVDVEELGEAEVRALGRRKRVKPPRIPLDQPPVLGVIRRRRGETGGVEGGGEGVSGSSLGSPVSPTSETGAGTQPKSPSPLSRFFTYALDQATAATMSTQQTLAAISPIPIPMPKPISIQNSNTGSGSTLVSIGVDADADSSSSPSVKQKHPMQCVLDVLTWTQGYHCTMAAQAGWVLVSSDSGVPVHRKLVSSLSSYHSPSFLNPSSPSTSNSILTPIPIHRGTKVIEGISAEELASVINEPGCRKKWDGKYFSEEVGFEMFGGSDTDTDTDTGGGGGNLGKTAFVVGKVGGAGLGGLIPLMFRDRGFYVASVVARGQGLDMGMGTSRRGTTTEGETTELGGDSNGTGSRNALFIVSASFNPSFSSSSPSSSSSTQLPFPFSPSKYNPSSLPIGHIHIDAWILETLDPYTKENYAVPSTRVTRLVGVDYAGSVPAAVNGMINATMVKSGILGLEGYVKNSGLGTFALPVLRLPAAGFVLGDRMDGDDDDGGDMNGKAGTSRYGWSLRKRDEYRTLLKTGFDTAERTYVAMVLVRFPGLGGCDSEATNTATTTTRLGKGSSSLSPSRHSSRQRQEQITPRASRVGLNTLPELELDEGNRGSNSSLDTISGLPSLSSSSLTVTSSEPGFPSSPTSPSFSMSNMASSTSMLTTSTSSSISSMPGGHRDRERERTISGSGSNMTFRGRSSSTFTLKGQVKQNTDLLVGEIVIDSTLYPKGYVVLLRSKTLASTTTASAGKIKVGSGSVRGSSTSKSPSRAVTRKGNKSKPNAKPIYLDSFFSSSSNASANANASDLSETFISSHSDTESDSGSEFQLPLQYTLHTMPSSPLHSSGMNIMNQPDNTSDSGYDYAPTRHLLRLTLPTAQYQILPAVEDPLTPPGETRQPLPKPKWLLEMEGEEGAMGAGAVVRVEVKPLDPSVSGSKGKGKVVVVDGRKGPSKDKDKDGRVWNKDQGGWEVSVVGEKESLTALGREVLLDDRVSSMSVLSRTTNELEQDADALPHDLRTAVAISDSLLDPDVMKDLEQQMSVSDGMDQSLDDGNGKENGDSNADDNNNGKETQSGVQAPEPNETPRPSLHTHLPGTRGMFLNFLNSYPNSLIGRFRVTSTADASSGEKHSKNGAVMEPKPNKVQMQNERPTGQVYPVSTLIVIALIAFLIGSLFRSLLSPADFIYVVQDIAEAEEAQVEGAGWREMRRLFEIKHILGGWDFQIAAVRRH